MDKQLSDIILLHEEGTRRFYQSFDVVGAIDCFEQVVTLSEEFDHIGVNYVMALANLYKLYHLKGDLYPDRDTKIATSLEKFEEAGGNVAALKASMS